MYNYCSFYNYFTTLVRVLSLKNQCTLCVPIVGIFVLIFCVHMFHNSWYKLNKSTWVFFIKMINEFVLYPNSLYCFNRLNQEINVNKYHSELVSQNFYRFSPSFLFFNTKTILRIAAVVLWLAVKMQQK